ncbi:MAG: BON domain-containing protein [Planctomycetes bacterium]|nr:BON domain-containing protein [Planctomycetota bacterium]
MSRLSRSILAAVPAALVAMLAASSPCAAQTNSLFSNRGPTGGASFGSTSSFSSTTGSGRTSSGVAGSTTGGFGGASAFGGTGGAGGLGTTGTGFGSTTGTAGGLGQNTFGQASGFGQTMQPGAFIGRSNTSGTFVGMQGAQQGFSPTTLPNFGGLPGGTTTQFGGNTGTTGTQRVIRPRQRIAFEVPRPSGSEIAGSLGTAFRTISSVRPELAGTTVTLDSEGVATLTGTVASERARRLAAAITRLEPGVRRVNNELTVAAAGNQ